MEAIQIKNLRSLADSTRIELRPLTMLLGANSSGKSTFVRTFPLFRQSVETRTTGPVLWYGHLVDFGNFRDALNLSSDNSQISFGFTIRTPGQPEHGTIFRNFYSPQQSVTIESIAIDCELVLQGQGVDTYASEYRIRFLEDELIFKFDAEGRCVNSRVNKQDFSESLKGYSLLPIGQIFQLVGNQDDRAYLESSAGRRFYRNTVGSLESLLLRHCSSYFDGRTRQDRRLAALRHVSIGSHQAMLSQLSKIPDQDEKWGRRVAFLKTDSAEFDLLRNTILLARLPRILSYADQHLVTTFSRSRYIAPIRASAERFYRSQNLAVDEVDAKGSNLAMFLSSLRPSAQKEFQEWTMKELGFSVRAHSDGAHATLRLETRGSSRSLNLADLGFGFSQILPVVAQIWHSIRNPGTLGRERNSPTPPSNIPKIIAIEQPELHLHPELQALVIDMIARVANVGKRTGNPFVFLIETHSETMVNRLGQLVSAQIIDAQDAQTLIFEKKEDSDVSTVRHSTYNVEGTLNDWPYGFFLPKPLQTDADSD